MVVVGGGGFTDGFDRADDPAALGNGWSPVSGSFQIVSGEARNQASKVLHMAVRPELQGAAQTVSTTFASTSNNVAPRFGVVLRYLNAGNYYLCYRQIGGSSVLRIAKVVNGVETVLKSAAVANPAQGSRFTLSCQATRGLADAPARRGDQGHRGGSGRHRLRQRGLRNGWKLGGRSLSPRRRLQRDRPVILRRTPGGPRAPRARALLDT